MRLTDQQRVAAAQLARRLNLAVEFAETIVPAFDEPELEAINSLREGDDVDALLRLAITAAEIREAARPLICAGVNFCEALEQIGKQARLIDRFSTMDGGELSINSRRPATVTTEAGGSRERRVADFVPTIKRSLGLENGDA